MKYLTFSKKLIIASFLTFNFLLSTFNSSAQAPQAFQYQAVVRNNAGIAIPSQAVGFQLSIISSSPTGTVEYVERHSANTNALGVVTLSVGAGTTTDNFSNINWGATTHFLKVEADPAGGTSYIDMGTTQLLSVPYSLYSETSGNADTLWNLNGNNIYNNNQGNVGVGINNPIGRMVVQGDSTASPSDPLFEVKNSLGQSVFVVWQDSVQVYINDDAIQSNRGGFAVSGRNTAKAFTNNYLKVTPDSSRIWTKDTLAGFGVENIGSSGSTSYLHLTPSNYFIGHQAGDSTTTGLYNSFIGYQSGVRNRTGKKNYFIGYRSGYNNINGNNNLFFGDSAGFSNINGFRNVFIGNESGYNNTDGRYNVFIGAKAGFSNTSGIGNVFIGATTGTYNTTGTKNVFVGNWCGNFNTTGSSNVFIGNQSGWNNSIGSNNIFMGDYCGYQNTTGFDNIFMGSRAGYESDTCYANIFIGNNSGEKNVGGLANVFLGNRTGTENISGSNNTIIGTESGHFLSTGFNNVFIGGWSGFNSDSSSNNVVIGLSAGSNIHGGSNNLILGNYAADSDTLGVNNVFVGNFAGRNASGSNNVFLGFGAGFWETGSNKLYIANTIINPPLIYGDFTTKKVTLNDVLILTPRTSPPTSPIEGEIYVNSLTHHIFCYLNGIWAQLD